MKFDFTNCLEERIGPGGIPETEIKRNIPLLQQIRSDLVRDRSSGHLRFAGLPYDKEMMDRVEELAFEHLKRWENIVLLGIGGSSLGNVMLFKALKDPMHNFLPKEQRQNIPRFFAADNIDPKGFESLLDFVGLTDTLFVVISKSGTTAETAATFSIVWDMLKKRKNEFACDHVVAITDPEKGVLRQIVGRENIATLPTPEGVEGRYSVLSDVGLFTSLLLGINIEKLLGGAKKMVELWEEAPVLDSPPIVNALIHYLASTKYNKNISVMMPYSNQLISFGDWYRQLWAESLGKKSDTAGNIVNVGQTPVPATGVTDQHSQLQLYIEGPNDKIFTFISIDDYKSGISIPDSFDHLEDISYLGNHKLEDLIKNEMTATRLSIAKNGRPAVDVSLPEINEYELGQLIMMYELQTAVSGRLYNINAFDQPGVEQGKLYTYGLMNRKGYEKYKNEVTDWIT